MIKNRYFPTLRTSRGRRSYQIVRAQDYSFSAIAERDRGAPIGWGLCLLIAIAAGPVEAHEPLVLEGHANVVASVCFSGDGSRLISGSWDKTVRVWHVAEKRAERTLRDHEDWVLDVAVSNSGSLMSATQSTLRRWKPSSPLEVCHGLGGAAINSVSFSPGGELLATGGRDGKVSLWRVGDSRPRHVFAGFESWVSCLALSADQKRLVAGTRAGRIRLLELFGAKNVHDLTGPSGQQLLALAIHPSDTLLASGGGDADVRLWDLVSKQEVGSLTGHKGMITALAWSPDGKLLASGERHGEIRVWDHAAGNLLRATLPGHSDDRLGFTVTDLCFSPRARLLASASYDKTIKIWQVPENE